MDADPIEGLTRLAAELQSFRRTTQAATRADTRHEGRDATGLVTLVADGSGRARSIDINRDWFAGRGPVGLGPAMFEAYQAAMTEVITAGVEQMTAAEEEEALRSPGVLDDAGSADGTRWDTGYSVPAFDDIRAALQEIEERQYEREYRRERRLAERSTGDRVLHGPSRFVAVTVRGGDVAEIAVTGSVRRDQLNDLEHDAVLALQSLRGSPATTRAAGDWTGR